MGEYFPSIPAFGRNIWRATRAVGRGLRKLGRAMLYLLPALVLLHLIAVVVTGHQLNNDIKRLTKAGIIVPAEQLIPKLPAGAENAADVYKKAWDALSISSEDEATLFDNNPSHDKIWLALGRKVVAANTEYYQLLDKATAIPDCIFQQRWDYPMAMSFPYFAKMRSAARMLTLKASVSAADGKTDEAISSIGTCFRIAKHTQTDPVLIGDLVSYAIQGIAAKHLQKILAQTNPAQNECKVLSDEIAKIDNLSSYNRTMRGEFGLCGLTYFNLFRSGKISAKYFLTGKTAESDKIIGIGSSAPLLVKIQAWIIRPLLNLDQRYYMKYMSEEIQVSALLWPDSEKAIKELEVRLNKETPWFAGITQAITPIFGRALWSRDRITAFDGTAQVALAVEAYRAEQGAYPTSLAAVEAAGWKLPLDTFGGKPFRYRQEGKGFVVWSIGPDMQDDNASKDFESYIKQGRTPEEQEKYDYDIVFRVKR